MIIMTMDNLKLIGEKAVEFYKVIIDKFTAAGLTAFSPPMIWGISTGR